MARPASRHPTELELEILKIHWRHGPLTPREVRDQLVGFRDLAYSSVATIMNIMVRKRYLGRDKPGSYFVYKTRVSEKATTRRMLRDLVNRVFGGSTVAVMVNLLEDADLDEAKVRELRAILKARMDGKGLERGGKGATRHPALAKPLERQGSHEARRRFQLPTLGAVNK
ncbi:MAG: BlaI/MecI/CopY family transcriptional regulator [Verrucomicrobia bacterium]|nr:BlaI/MecI/CopY family transcriptional regulator [Verrucomicrobiota bacterium]